MENLNYCQRETERGREREREKVHVCLDVRRRGIRYPKYERT